ncbi:MAG: ferric uptake regulator, Fur family [Dehalococcoidia bacterium]|nr:ferric uptake regulator, Fur family [Dehalococcoidia bacterium]
MPDSELSKTMRIKKATRSSLGGGGERTTRQRAILLELLQQGAHHLDADELYRLARRRLPRLSLSTVYRSLQLFKKMGLVQEHHFAEEHHHYEVKPETDHQHLQCLKCGKIIEFRSPVTEKLKEAVGQEHDFIITGLEMDLLGLCGKCRREGKA